jgi:hypothetical protein
MQKRNHTNNARQEKAKLITIGFLIKKGSHYKKPSKGLYQILQQNYKTYKVTASNKP